MTNKPLSNCCHAPMTVVGKTTMYYVCTKCGMACDMATDNQKEAGNEQER